MLLAQAPGTSAFDQDVLAAKGVISDHSIIQHVAVHSDPRPTETKHA